QVKSCAGSNGAKFLAAGLAPIYLAYSDLNSWLYDGLHGALVLVHDRGGWLTLGTMWKYGAYRGFQLWRTKLVLWNFSSQACGPCGTVRRFEDSSTCLNNITLTAGKIGSIATFIPFASSVLRSPTKKGGCIHKSLAFGPVQGDCIQFAHKSSDSERRCASTGCNPPWKPLVGDLEVHGVNEKMTQENTDSMKHFMADAYAVFTGSAAQVEEGA
ncbi:hypothetical protein PENSPDRAFT_581525, partial [Peniophora sp. CONT]